MVHSDGLRGTFQLASRSRSPTGSATRSRVVYKLHLNEVISLEYIHSKNFMECTNEPILDYNGPGIASGDKSDLGLPEASKHEIIDAQRTVACLPHHPYGKRAHNRSLTSFIATNLNNFTSSKQMLQAIYDAFLDFYLSSSGCLYEMRPSSR
ncbi:hypothetical protein BDZ97DRAFT_301601 [Flammula alnicola]|nr:hypothetical protein BDZ97DRAFT_301601 [Flammula alnicola]